MERVVRMEYVRERSDLYSGSDRATDPRVWKLRLPGAHALVQHGLLSVEWVVELGLVFGSRSVQSGEQAGGLLRPVRGAGVHEFVRLERLPLALRCAVYVRGRHELALLRWESMAVLPGTLLRLHMEPGLLGLQRMRLLTRARARSPIVFERLR